MIRRYDPMVVRLLFTDNYQKIFVYEFHEICFNMEIQKKYILAATSIAHINVTRDNYMYKKSISQIMILIIKTILDTKITSLYYFKILKLSLKNYFYSKILRMNYFSACVGNQS